MSEAMTNFMSANPLHPDVFPAVRKMESEVVSMCLNLCVVFSSPDFIRLTSLKLQCT